MVLPSDAPRECCGLGLAQRPRPPRGPVAFTQWDDRLVGFSHVGTEFFVPVQAVNGLDWYTTNLKSS